MHLIVIAIFGWLGAGSGSSGEREAVLAPRVSGPLLCKNIHFHGQGQPTGRLGENSGFPSMDLSNMYRDSTGGQHSGFYNSVGHSLFIFFILFSILFLFMSNSVYF